MSGSGEIEIYKLTDVDCDNEPTAESAAFPSAVNADQTTAHGPRILLQHGSYTVELKPYPGGEKAAKADVPPENKLDKQITSPTTSHIVVHACNVCGKAFTSRPGILDHISSHHNQLDLGYIKCQYCMDYFSSELLLQQHIDEQHVLAPHCCEQCGKRFALKYSLTLHLRIHSNELKPFQCEVCGKKYSQAIHLHEHRHSHTGARPYICEICSRTFTHVSNLHKHERTVHGKHEWDKYECDKCGKQFSEQGNLYKHMQAIHSGGKGKWECEICGEMFRWHATRSAHQIKVHAQEIGHKCGDCDKRFVTLSRLRYHQRKHTGERPFTCDICFKTFGYETAMKRHSKLHSQLSNNQQKAPV